MDALIAIENSSFGIWVRESGSIWSYPTIIFLHSLGLSFLVGMNVALDLRLLGFAPGLPLEPMRQLFGLMRLGFWVNALSGIALSPAAAPTLLVSPVFYVKMGLIAAAVVNMVLMKRRVFEPSQVKGGSIPLVDKLLATTSILLWMGAITAGRLTAYLGPVAGLNGR